MSNALLENISTEELQEALAARQTGAINRANEHQRQTWQAYEDEKKARTEANQVQWQRQSPYDWGRHFVSAGIPVAAARIFAECVAVIFKRLAALEKNQQPAHLRDLEKRNL